MATMCAVRAYVVPAVERTSPPGAVILMSGAPPVPGILSCLTVSPLATLKVTRSAAALAPVKTSQNLLRLQPSISQTVGQWPHNRPPPGCRPPNEPQADIPRLAAMPSAPMQNGLSPAMQAFTCPANSNLRCWTCDQPFTPPSMDMPGTVTRTPPANARKSG